MLQGAMWILVLNTSTRARQSLVEVVFFWRFRRVMMGSHGR